MSRSARGLKGESFRALLCYIKSKITYLSFLNVNTSSTLFKLPTILQTKYLCLPDEYVRWVGVWGVCGGVGG